MLYHYKLVIAYDGTDYHGWQMQHALPTITKVLSDTFIKVFDHDVVIVGASRTDAGVHAAGQVARATTPLDIDAQKMFHAWNNVLPPSIVIRSIEKVDASFLAQRNVAHKTYHYQVFTRHPLPFQARYGWFYRLPLDLKKLEQALQIFVGTHDFRAFCTMEDGDKRSTIRTISTIKLEVDEQQGTLTIIVQGHSFLHYMIRRIVGACLHVAARKELSGELLVQALNSKDPNTVLPKAPAHGLMLLDIRYEE